MTGPAPRFTGGEGSAQPGPRVRSPRKHRKPEHRFLLRVMEDGDLRFSDLATRKKLRTAGFKRHEEVIAYLYRVRDPVQWRRAHVLGDMLAQNHDRFAGMQAHDVLKALQLEEGVACRDVETVVTLLDDAGDACGIGRRKTREAESLEFGNVDEGEWQAIWKRLCQRAGRYFGDIDAEAVEAMLDLMPQDPA